MEHPKGSYLGQIEGGNCLGTVAALNIAPLEHVCWVRRGVICWVRRSRSNVCRGPTFDADTVLTIELMGDGGRGH